MESGSGLGSAEFANDAMSTTDNGRGAARKSCKEIADLEATVSKLRKEMVEVKQRQQQIETRAAIYEAEIEELREREKQSKVEIAQAKQAQQEAEKCIALYQEQLEGNHDGVDWSKFDFSRLNTDTTCEICTSNMWYPCLLPECGHMFCERCIDEWFGTTLAQHYNEHPSFIWGRPMEVPDEIRDLFLQGSIERYRLAVAYEQFNPNTGAPPFSCPTCRKLVKHLPVEVYKMKSVVENVAFSKGDIIPERQRPGRHEWQSLWGRYFPCQISVKPW